MLGFKTNCAYKNLQPCENMDKNPLSSFWNQWAQPLAYVIYTLKDNCARDKLSPAMDHPKIRLYQRDFRNKITIPKLQKAHLILPIFSSIAVICDYAKRSKNAM